GVGIGGEEGALVEATCDFFAQMVKAWLSQPGPTIPDVDIPWEIGRGVGHGTPLRYRDKPSRDGRSQDAGYDGLGLNGADFAAGVGDRALYYLSRGAPTALQSPAFSAYLPQGMAGIGNDAAARIWFKTITERLHGGTGASLGEIRLSTARD